MRRRLSPLLAVLALLACGAALLGGCGGNSDQENAQTAVCDARDDIGTQVDRLASLTISTATADDVKSSLESIQDDLQTIADNRAELSDDRRQEVETATTRFTDAIRSVAGDLGRSLSLSQARTQLSAALSDLRSAYRSTLAQVQCD